MTTTTDLGLEWIGDKTIDNVNDSISKIAVGSGSGNESTVASSLANEVYRGDVADSNVTQVESSATGRFDTEVVVTGGVEVPANTVITEIALFSGSGVMIVIDDFDSGVTVGAGVKQSFQIRFNPTR